MQPVPRKILRRLLEELSEWYEQNIDKEQKGKERHNTITSNDGDIHDLVKDLTQAVDKICHAGFRTIIIIDALNKVQEFGQTFKVRCKTSKNSMYPSI